MERIVIVGVGALGSHVALFLRNIDKTIVVVDYDRVETKNIQAQFHSKMGLRRNKAQALQLSLQGLFGVKIEAIPHKLVNNNISQLLSNSTLVIDCTDNIAARRTIQDYVRLHKIPCLHGALSADGSFGRVVWDEHFTADEEGTEGEATCEDGIALPFFALAAGQIAIVAQRFIEDGVKQSFQLSHIGAVRLA